MTSRSIFWILRGRKKFHRSNTDFSEALHLLRQWCAGERHRSKILVPTPPDFELLTCARQTSVLSSEKRERNTCFNDCCKNKSPTLVTTFMPTISRSFLSGQNFSSEFHIHILSPMFHSLFKNKCSKVKLSSLLSNLTDQFYIQLKMP